MIEAINLTKKFGKLVAVNNLNLNIKKGELFVFLGPNGAGKTTTIKMFTGLLKPTDGSAEVGGFDLQKEPVKAKKIIGYIPEDPFLYEKLTGYEFLNFIGDVYQVDGNKKRKRASDLLHLLGMEERSNELIQSYSRGMRQKIALAGSLIHEPEVLFLDEPTAGVDPKGARMIKDILKELTRRGTTIFMSTHILEIAERMCDRVGIINKGEVIAVGTMGELRKKSLTTAKSLEDIFLELTGGEQVLELVKYLEE